jgi:hypothetical protein
MHNSAPCECPPARRSGSHLARRDEAEVSASLIDRRCATMRRSQGDFSMLRKSGFRLAEDFREIQHRSGYGRIRDWASVPQSSPQAAH